MQHPSTFSELSRPIVSRGWPVESRVRAIAGTLVLVSVALAVVVDVRWLILAAFVGANLIQSSFTGWCLMSNLVALVAPRLGKGAP